MSYAPWRRCPLTKNVGVPDTRPRSAPSTSCGDPLRRNVPSQVLGEARHVEPESVGVRRQVGHRAARPGARAAGRASARTRPDRRRPPRPGPPAGRAGARLRAAGAATRTGRRAKSASSSRTTGSARPQYGHSKSPYSTRVTGASRRRGCGRARDRPATARSMSGSAAPSRAALRAPLRQQWRWRGRRASVSSEAARAAASDAELGLVELVRRRRPGVAISSETVKPTPALVPRLRPRAQPTVGRIRPRSAGDSQAVPTTPSGLPAT